jgi:hypothetical protein
MKLSHPTMFWCRVAFSKSALGVMSVVGGLYFDNDGTLRKSLNEFSNVARTLMEVLICNSFFSSK